MKILHDLIFQAGGYSFDDLKKASSTERRQILQLGCAVLFSTFASIINWAFASVHLLGDVLTGAMIAYPIFITALVVFPISLSINRNLIFYSDTHENKQITYTYSSEKEATHTLPYVRFALVAIVCGINFSLINANAAQLSLIALLGIFELYPLMLKKQMGQTILGRRMQARLQFQHKRGELKGEQYAALLAQMEHEQNESPKRQTIEDHYFHDLEKGKIKSLNVYIKDPSSFITSNSKITHDDFLKSTNNAIKKLASEKKLGEQNARNDAIQESLEPIRTSA